jgi:NAD(P)-dependent dehydrogenase (short-subunit alcohol dehydrogenase family)
MGKLDGKVVVVTGALGGMGREACRRFGAEGAAVVGIDRTEEGVQEFSTELIEEGVDFEFQIADISVSSEVDAAADAVREWCGHIDVLYNNAGIMVVKPLLEITDEEWNAGVAVNLTSAFLMTRAFVPLMPDGRGSIINVSSMGGLRVFPTQAAYSAPKAALIHLTRTMASELAPKIRVNAICPGNIDTPMARGYIDSTPDPAAALAGLERGIPLGRFGTSGEIVNVGVWLASDEASYLTGSIVVADGGSILNGSL